MFIEKIDMYNHFITEAHINGEKVAEYIRTASAIDDGRVEVYTPTLPWRVALWIKNIRGTNHGWYEIKGSRLLHKEIDRYTCEERGYKVADLY